MVWSAVTRVALLLFLLSWASAAPAADSAKPIENKAKSGIKVWDTGQPSANMLPAAGLAGKNDWAAIPLNKNVESFTGDAVLRNDRIAVVLRKQSDAAEVYALKPGGAVARGRLYLRTISGDAATRLERVALVDNSRAGGCLEATFKTEKGTEVAAKFRIKRGDVFVQAEPGIGAGALCLDYPGRFVVLPDFFADDITIDATKQSPGALELPSDNFILHLSGAGDAIAMCVFENRRQDVKVAVAGVGDQRQFKGSEVGFEGRKIWVALLEAPGIWHMRDLEPADTGKVIPLEWKMPFPAQWRVDFTRPNNLTDSWEMLLQENKNDEYTKPSWLGSEEDTLDARRGRWNTVLGDYKYPCWSDFDRRGYLQPLKNKALRFQGPALIYPINRVKQTPLDAYTVVDVMRNTLGTGPCEHLLDLEGQKAEYRGRATCSVRDVLTPIYQKHEQIQKHTEVDRTLDEGLVFVKHIRSRITRYVEFEHKMREYLTEQKKTHPELADFIGEMEKLNEEIDRRVAARVAKIKTPAHVARMNEDFRKEVLDYEGPDALKRCKKYTRALVEIGDNQDELSAECRWVVKTLRQRAGILLALDPRVAPIASEIRARTQEALRNPANHEGARH